MSGVKRLVAVVLVSALPCTAQAPSVWQWHEVPAAASTVLAVLWQHGYDDDAPGECGAARALAECRLERARQRVPAATDCGLQVLDDATVAFVLVPATAAARGVEFCAALLDDSLAVDDDLLLQARARAALGADDAEWLYPGPVLVSRARRALLGAAAAHAVAGSAVAVQALTPARLRALLRQPVTVFGVGVGAVSADLQAAAAALPRPVPGPPGARVAAAAAAAGDDLPTAGELLPHPRCDGPFTAIAFEVAPACGRAALALGVEVARGRAARTLRLRGGEAAARAPLVAWSWLRGEPLLVFCRRGRNGDDAARSWAELDALLADLAARPPTVAECDIAARTLRTELGLSAAAATAGGAGLPGWATSQLLLRLRGIAAADLAAVTPASAHAALRATCDPARAFRCGLVPGATPASR